MRSPFNPSSFSLPKHFHSMSGFNKDSWIAAVTATIDGKDAPAFSAFFGEQGESEWRGKSLDDARDFGCDTALESGMN